MPPRALKAAGQISEESMAHFEMLEVRLGKWIGKAQAQHNQRPPEYGTDGKAPCRPVLMEAHAAIDGAGQTVTTRAIDGVLAEKGQHDEAERRPCLAESKGQKEKDGVQRHE